MAAMICAAQNPWVVRMDGFGPVHVGMTLRQLNAILHTSYTLPTDPDERACFYAEIPNHSDVNLMILNGRVGRMDVDNPDARTERGLHNGSTESEALRTYGKQLKVTAHAYNPENGHYLTVLSPDRRYGIRFETADGKIEHYYAGQRAAIAYIEGCS